jgi:hypothetical protein
MAMASCFPIDGGGANEEIHPAKTRLPAEDLLAKIRQNYKREPQHYLEIVKAGCGRCRSMDPRSQPDHRTESTSSCAKHSTVLLLLSLVRPRKLNVGPCCRLTATLI